MSDEYFAEALGSIVWPSDYFQFRDEIIDRILLEATLPDVAQHPAQAGLVRRVVHPSGVC